MDHDEGTLYAPLDESIREIRLVRFPGVGSSGHVSCSLSTSNLSQSEHGKLQYIALSYLWGDPGQTEGILVNGRRFTARTNLVSFFRHYENVPMEYRDLPIWIDAICINQADLDERTAQVNLMGDIYRQATASISWLGTSSEDSHLAVSTISLCANYLRRATGESSVDWLENKKELLGTVNFEPPQGQALPRNKAWAAVARFMGRPYWTRIWMYQEIVLPSCIVLLCGDETLPIDDLLVFIEWMRNVDLKFGCPHVDEKIFPISLWPQWLSILGIGRLEKHLVNRKKQYEQSSPRQEVPEGVAEMFPVGLTATDPRDIVYGVLGALPIPVTPDYRKSVEEVYVEFTVYLVGSGHLSSVLSQQSSSEHRRRKDELGNSTDLPSWVPDFGLYGFRQLSERRPFVHADSIDSEAVWTQGIPKAFKPEPHGRMLRVSGVVCEQIVEEPEIFYYETALSNIQRFLPGEIYDGVKYYPTGIPIHQALVRILLKDPGMLRDDDNSRKIDVDMILGAAIPVYESMLAPERSTEELFAFWRTVGFKYEIPTHEELQIMLFGRRLNDAQGVIRYNKDRERYIARRKMAMFQIASWDQQYMFRTQNGYIGMSEGEAKSGDQVCIIFGCREPVILRPVGAY